MMTPSVPLTAPLIPVPPLRVKALTSFWLMRNVVEVEVMVPPLPPLLPAPLPVPPETST